jgi:PIN domain nuclease of toxin-antitoxin system
MSRYILDACALIAYLNDEEGADIVENIFDQALNGQTLISMGIVNLLEVYYGILRDLGLSKADEVLNECCSLPVKIINDISADVFKNAGRMKASYHVSLADSLALGLALTTGDFLLTADHHEFDAIEAAKEPIKFAWIRQTSH